MTPRIHDWRIDPAELRSLFQRFAGLRIGLLGDLFLDRYLEIDGAIEEVSIETGLAAHQVVRIRNAPGALGTVMSNLAALGAAELIPLTILGDDGHGDDLRRQLAKMPVDASHIVRSSDRLTPTYIKPLLTGPDGVRELNRLDVRDRRPHAPESIARMCDALKTMFQQVDGWIVLDQIPEAECGVVCDSVRRVLAQCIDAAPETPVLIDSRAQLSRFARGILKGNRHEMARTLGLAEDAPIDLIVRQLQEGERRVVFCTDGGAGVWCIDPHGQTHHVASRPLSGPLDIVGAGDAFSSGTLLSLAAGADASLAAKVGNLAASITVTKIGETGVATEQEMLNAD